MCKREMSEEGVEWLAQLEGTKTKVYKDSAGLPTIGVGHLLLKEELTSGKIAINGEYVRYRRGLSLLQVERLFQQDLRPFEAHVRSALSVSLMPHQYDALVSFCFNVGGNAFRSSTLLRRVNENRWKGVPGQFRRWKYSAGKVVKGLQNRREKEILMWRGLV